MQKLGVSFICSMTMSLLLYPCDTVKRNFQLNGARNYTTRYVSYKDCYNQILKEQGGVRALYRGVHIYALREIFTAFTQLSIWEALFENRQNIKE